MAVKAGKKQNAWEVDAISGATISSVAVAKALDRSMQRMAPLIQRYRQELSRARAMMGYEPSAVYHVRNKRFIAFGGDS